MFIRHIAFFFLAFPINCIWSSFAYLYMDTFSLLLFRCFTFFHFRYPSAFAVTRIGPASGTHSFRLHLINTACPSGTHSFAYTYIYVYNTVQVIFAIHAIILSTIKIGSGDVPRSEDQFGSHIGDDCTIESRVGWSRTDTRRERYVIVKQYMCQHDL